MIRIETLDGRYKAQEDVLQGKAAIVESMKSSKLQARLGHCNNNILCASISHIDGVQ